MDIDEIKKLCSEDIVKAKKIMAYEVTKLVHGEKEAQSVKELSEQLFTSGNANSESMPTESITLDDKQILTVDFLAKLSIFPSKSEARRLVLQGGVSIDDQKLVEPMKMLVLDKDEYILKNGKKTLVKVKIN